MFDKEVERLRRLRAAALRVRAVARALGRGDTLLNRGRCAAWRVARIVSGRLRAHPYASYQKDAGIGVVAANSLAAANAALGVRTRHQGLLRFEAHLRSLARELSDVRALTSASDLNDSFARSQIEIRALLAALGVETRGQYEPRGQYETRGVQLSEASAMAPVTDAGSALTVDSDWPYLAF
ncbi:MAG TPA: hypothetical protein VN325_22765 [Steroidobacteraceae bacterium]|nr:hypothetical protein [Steroidobacteraceae bacterium]